MPLECAKMRLYFSPFSSNSHRVLAVAAELGVSLELEEIDLSAGQQQTESFLALNPNGKVPVLRHDDLVLWESTAIINYLAETAQSRLLWPSSPSARAELFKWQSWTLNHFVRVSDVFLFENVVKGFFGLGEPNAAALATAHDDMCALYKLLDDVLAASAFLIGDTCSLADHHLYPAFNIKHHLQLPPLGPYPGLSRWAGAMSESNGWKSLNP